MVCERLDITPKQTTEHFQALALQVLNMQGNQIETIAAINIPLLAQLPALTTLCFQNIDLTASNPACQSSGYQASILQHLPSLRNLDGER